MIVGPVFSREAAVAPRRGRHFLGRGVYATILLLLMFTAWLVMTGTQRIQNVGDMARFGTALFQVLAPLQLALMLFLAAMQSASNVSIEKDRETLILLLMSRLTNSELVLGKLLASLLNIGVMLLTALPIFMMIVLFGGTSFAQVFWSFAVTAATVLVAGSIGATLAFWREKTFQALALTAIAIVFWVGAFEGLALLGEAQPDGMLAWIAAAGSPLRAILAASQPTVTSTWPTEVLPFLVAAVVASAFLCGLAILRVRRWNPSRDVRITQSSAEATKSDVDMFTGEVIGVKDLATSGLQVSGKQASGRQAVADGEKFRSGHVDDRQRVEAARSSQQKSRRVWDNPVLWREICTWAYGKKILFIRAVYWAMAAVVFFVLWSMVTAGLPLPGSGPGIQIPTIARPLAPFLFLSIVMVNALAVTAITTERDGRALDLLMVTDLSPGEFLFGKLLGVMTVAADMILLPIAMMIFLCLFGVISIENTAYLAIGFTVVNVFGVMLGLHCGMSYSFSRQAIAVSLGTVFFLFLGVITSMVMMVSFTGSVEAQFGPFLACLVGGAIGLYIALGWNAPSPALALASAALPTAMFYCITSLILGNYLAAFLVLVVVYSFTTIAMMLPRLSEFLVSTRRSRDAGND